MRWALVTANALTFFDSICGVLLVACSHIKSTCPPSRSFIAGPVPLYGTKTMSLFSAFCSRRLHRCDAEPTPALARLILPPLAAMYLRSSAKFVAGSACLPISVDGASLIRPRNSSCSFL